jgi:hypothetical protein
MLLPYYLLSTTRAVEVAIGTSVMCFPELSICVMAVLLVLVQLRTLHSLTWIASASGIAITLAMILLLVDFAIYAPSTEHPGAGFNKMNETHMWPKTDSGIVAVYGSTASFIFAYQGQS